MDDIPATSPEYVYNPGQLQKLMPFVGKHIEWFLLGGPADGNEAQTLHRLRPQVQILACEPNPEFYKQQLTRGFPGRLLPVALWHEAGVGELRCAFPRADDLHQHDRGSSLTKYFQNYSKSYRVPTATLDQLSELYGPFRNAFLWIDIEGAELDCLVGASKLLEQKLISLVNLEAFEDTEKQIGNFLRGFGFEEVYRWNQHHQEKNWCDLVYRLKVIP